MGKWDVYLDGKSGGVQKCTICKAQLKCQKNSSTNGYRYHFKTKHPEIFNKVEEGKCEVSKPPEKKMKIHQPTIQESFSLWAENSPRNRQVERAIVQMIATDFMPLQTPNKAGFRNLLKILAPKFKVKDRTYFTRTLLPEVYKEYRDKLKFELVDVDHVALSIDLWTDKNMKHDILGATAHFVGKDGLPKHRILSAIDSSEVKHTGHNITKMIESIIREFGLEGKIVALLRDGAANVALAGRLLNVESWDCWSHKLNLVSKKGTSTFSCLDELIEKIKKIIRRVRKSSSVKKEFEQFQVLSSFTPRMLIKNCEVRWTSLYEMLRRFLELKTPIGLLLASHPDYGCFDDNDWSLISAVLEMLTPIVRSTQQSQGKDALSSTIIPTITILKVGLAKPATYPAPRQAMIEKLSAAMNEYRKNEYLKISTMLDPRYRMAFVDPVDKELLISRIKEMVDAENHESAIEGCEDVAQRKPEEMDPFEEYFLESGSNVTPASSTVDLGILIYSEVEKWSKEVIIPTVDPFEFWRSPINQAQYPHLHKLVPKYFAAPPGSSATERLFSSAGNILTENRKSLTKEHFHQLLFLSSNIPLMGYEI